MLLEIDGLHRRWANGVPSDYEGPLGLHDSIGDVRNGLDAEVFARVRDSINYDTSSGVRNAIYHNASTKVTTIDKNLMSLLYGCSFAFFPLSLILVERYTYKFRCKT